MGNQRWIEIGTVDDIPQRGARRVYVNGCYADAPVYARLALPAGAIVPGPAILEQPDTTIFIDPGLVGTVDRFGNLILA